jgi:hypothetical protein
MLRLKELLILIFRFNHEHIFWSCYIGAVNKYTSRTNIKPYATLVTQTTFAKAAIKIVMDTSIKTFDESTFGHLKFTKIKL